MNLVQAVKRWIRRVALPIGAAAALAFAASHAWAGEDAAFQVAFFDAEAEPLTASELAQERGAGIDEASSETSSGDRISVILWDEMSPRKASTPVTQSQVGTGSVSATLNGQSVY